MTLAGLVLLMGCNPRAETALSPSPNTSPTSATTGTGCTTITAPPRNSPQKDSDASGHHAVFLTGIDQEKSTVTYDVVSFYFGEEAIEPYRRDYPEEETGPANDYYIVNEKVQLRTLEVAADACLAAQTTNDSTSVKALLSLKELSKALESQWDPADPSVLSGNPFWITKENGRITAIRQQYIP